MPQVAEVTNRNIVNFKSKDVILTGNRPFLDRKSVV